MEIDAQAKYVDQLLNKLEKAFYYFFALQIVFLGAVNGIGCRTSHFLHGMALSQGFVNILFYGVCYVKYIRNVVSFKAEVTKLTTDAAEADLEAGAVPMLPAAAAEVEKHSPWDSFLYAVMGASMIVFLVLVLGFVYGSICGRSSAPPPPSPLL